ncbi:MAG: ETC complex I subunit [Pseudomonadota bacterium]
MLAKIYQPAKSAMQSGPGRSDEWVLEYVPQERRSVDPLMGYTTSSDTQSQVKLSFETQDAAIAYAERNGIPYQVIEPTRREHVRKSYADNFKFGRIGSWTH